MKKYTDEDPLHGNGKATPKPRKENQSSRKEPWMRAPFDHDNYIRRHDGAIQRRHLPLNRRPSRRALKRNAAAILAK